MAKLEHAALWAKDIDKLKAFYEKYFEAKSNAKYINEQKRFQSYFLSFLSGARLEIMQRPGVETRERKNSVQEFIGYAHLAFSVGSENNVDNLTDRLQRDGYKKLDGPRRTGDGYYESVVLDPEGNRIEITV